MNRRYGTYHAAAVHGCNAHSRRTSTNRFCTSHAGRGVLFNTAVTRSIHGRNHTLIPSLSDRHVDDKGACLNQRMTLVWVLGAALILYRPAGAPDRCSPGNPRRRIHAARRHALDQSRGDDLHELQLSDRARDHRQRRQLRQPQLLRRHPQLHQRHRQPLPHHRVPRHARHRCARPIRPARSPAAWSSAIKYAFLQTNLDDWMTRGSWARFGIQQTPYMDFIEEHLPLSLPGHDARGARGLHVVVRRRRLLPLQLPAQLRRRPRRGLQRREVQPRRGQQSEGTDDARHRPAVRRRPRQRCAAFAATSSTTATLRERRRAAAAQSAPSPTSTRPSSRASNTSTRATSARRCPARRR